jgi:hypothetical protein
MGRRAWVPRRRRAAPRRDRAPALEIVRLLRGRGSTLVVTHDRRFITPDDIVLEIEDRRLSSRPGVAPPVAASS